MKKVNLMDRTEIINNTKINSSIGTGCLHTNLMIYLKLLEDGSEKRTQTSENLSVLRSSFASR